MVIHLKTLLQKQIAQLRPDAAALHELSQLSKRFVSEITDELKRKRVDANVFVGGSFAKGTFLKAVSYDVDVFVRFDWKYASLSDILETILLPVLKRLGMHLERVHGSRDYFIVSVPNTPGYFEVIPVTRIKKPQEERNVTDLTYFHGPYVTKRIKGLEDQVRLTKQFFKAQRVYGAETYAQGFSGYTVELLIIHYKSFLKLIRNLSKIGSERVVIDIAKHYPRKQEVFIHLNEAKLHSPIILIDPTYKERNALAALSHETFSRLQTAARVFLARPSPNFFAIHEPNFDALRAAAIRKKHEFVALSLTTDKQPGDIAGTKLKKFFEYLVRELGAYFVIKNSQFQYAGGHRGLASVAAVARKEIVRIGPPMMMKKHTAAFRKQHALTFVRNGYIHANMPFSVTLRSFLDAWTVAHVKTMHDMHITSMSIKN